MVFVIHWHESAMDLHVFPIPIPAPISLSTRSLWVFPVHQVRALVSCIQPGLVICFTLDNIYISMLFSQHFLNISPISPPHPQALVNIMSLSAFMVWGFKKLFYFWLHWIIIAEHRLSLVAVSGGYSSCGVWDSHCGKILLLGSTGSRAFGLSSYGTRVWLPCSMWDLPRPGIKLVPCFGRWILNHWTTREAQEVIL